MIFKSYKKNTEGNVATMFAVSLLTLIAAAGTAVDYSRITKANSKLQDLTDSLALAAAIGIKNEVQNVTTLDDFSRIFLKQSKFSNAQWTWALENNELALTLSVTEPMIFMGIFGQPDKTIKTIARVPVTEKTDITVALVLDSTESMRGTRINSLRIAANQLIDILTETDSNETYMSVVPFTNMVKLPVSSENEIWFDKPENKDFTLRTVNLDPSVNCRFETTGEQRRRVCDETVHDVTPVVLEWNGCMISRRFGFHNVPEYATQTETQRLQGFVNQGYCSNNLNRMRPQT